MDHTAGTALHSIWQFISDTLWCAAWCGANITLKAEFTPAIKSHLFIKWPWEVKKSARDWELPDITH